MVSHGSLRESRPPLKIQERKGRAGHHNGPRLVSIVRVLKANEKPLTAPPKQVKAISNAKTPYKIRDIDSGIRYRGRTEVGRFIAAKLVFTTAAAHEKTRPGGILIMLKSLCRTAP